MGRSIPAIVAVSVAVGIFTGLSLGDLSPVGTWAFRYQTLISGLIALAGAGLGAFAIYRQIKQADLLEGTRRENRKRASRAVLPLTLAGFSSYALEVGALLGEIYSRITNQNPGAAYANHRPLSAPAIPNRAVDELKEFVELSEAGEAKFIALLLSDIQVLAANVDATLAEISGVRGHRSVVPPNVTDYAIRAGQIYARAGSLFDYARGEQQTVPTGISWHEVDRALFVMYRHGDILDRARDTICRRSDGNLNRGV